MDGRAGVFAEAGKAQAKTSANDSPGMACTCALVSRDLNITFSSGERPPQMANDEQTEPMVLRINTVFRTHWQNGRQTGLTGLMPPGHLFTTIQPNH